MDSIVKKISINDAGEATDVSIDDTLQERGNRYGSFSNHASLSTGLRFAMFNHMEQYNTEEFMICHKLARIANGDPHYDDSWRDIAGYAQLVVDNINGKNT
jgi:hypothetical protein